MSNEEIVNLQSKSAKDDNDVIKIRKEAICKFSVTVSHMLDDLGEENNMETIPLPNIETNDMLEKIVEYCNHHFDNPEEHQIEQTDDKKPEQTEICEWDKEFLSVDQTTLFELILAANYLDMKKLLDDCCKTVANMIKNKSPEEIRKTFNIKNDFTEEEEEQIRKENEWCMEL